MLNLIIDEDKNMKIDDNKKVDILLLALEERYSSIHKIRERVQNICVWGLGLLLGASGWLFQSEFFLTSLQKTIAIFSVIVAFVVLRFVFLENLQKGFKGQQHTAVQLEKILGFFTPKTFNDSEESIYPKNWESAGTEKGDGKFFNSTYALLYVGITFFIIAILLNGCFAKYIPNTNTSFYHFWRH